MDAAEKRVCSIGKKENQIRRLDFIQNQMKRLTLDVEKKIRGVTEEVANKVSCAVTGEICRFSVLIDKFCPEFRPISSGRKVYKNELNKHIQDDIGGYLSHQCTNEVNTLIIQYQ